MFAPVIVLTAIVFNHRPRASVYHSTRTVNQPIFTLFCLCLLARAAPAPGAEIGGANIEVEFDGLMHSRVVAWFAGKDTPLGPVTSLEFIVVNGSPVKDFSLKNQRLENVSDARGSGQQLVITGVSGALQKTETVACSKATPACSSSESNTRTLDQAICLSTAGPTAAIRYCTVVAAGLWETPNVKNGAHTRNSFRSFVVASGELATKVRTAPDHREQHSRNAHIEAENGAAVHLAACVDATCWLADEAEVLGIFQRNLVRLDRRQLGSSLDQFAVPEAAARRNVDDGSVFRAALVFRDLPLASCGEEEQLPGMSSGPAAWASKRLSCRRSIFSLKNEPEESVVGPLVLDSPFHE
jgi:hypothetical protein